MENVVNKVFDEKPTEQKDTTLEPPKETPQKKYYRKNKVKICEKEREKYNTEEEKQKKKEYYQKNKEKLKEKQKERYEHNKSEIKSDIPIYNQDGSKTCP